MTERESFIAAKRSADEAEAAKLRDLRDQLAFAQADLASSPKDTDKRKCCEDLEHACSSAMHALSRFQQDAYEQMY